MGICCKILLINLAFCVREYANSEESYIKGKGTLVMWCLLRL